MPYWHLMGGPVEAPVYVDGQISGYALGIATGLVGPVERPPIEEDHVDEFTGERYDHLASWNWKPTEAEIESEVARVFPQYAGREPFLTLDRDDDATDAGQWRAT